ncbi:MAG: RidA family protein [Chitinophagaceae bacterium]
MKTIVNTHSAPAPIGPYSQAVIANGMLYISGQIAIIPETGEIEISNVTAEAHQVMKNLQAILAEAKIGFENVVKTTILLTSMDLFARVNEVYGSYFTEGFPARETFAVKGLPKNVNIEISMIAFV